MYISDLHHDRNEMRLNAIWQRNQPTSNLKRLRGEMILKQIYWPEFQSVQYAFKDLMIHESCNSHYVSQFAAFFIVARAKRSVAESCAFNLFVIYQSGKTRVGQIMASMQPKGAESCQVKCTMHKCERLCWCTVFTVMILPQVHLRKPCYDFYFL